MLRAYEGFHMEVEQYGSGYLRYCVWELKILKSDILPC